MGQDPWLGVRSLCCWQRELLHWGSSLCGCLSTPWHPSFKVTWPGCWPQNWVVELHSTAVCKSLS